MIRSPQLLKFFLILIPLLIGHCIQLIAQDNLTGKWVSDSMFYKNYKIGIVDKRDKTILTFNQDNTYVKEFYGLKNLADSGKFELSIHITESKKEVRVTNANQKKIIERGTYQVNKDGILFDSRTKKYTVPYQIENVHLLLYERDHNDEEWIIKFKRL